MIADQQYQLFLAKLVADQMGQNPLTISEWEQRFLASFSQRVRQDGWLTDGRRVSADRMWMRYGPDLGMPHPLDTVSERPAIAPADSDGCEYLERDPAGRQQRCNAPAEWQGERSGPRRGLRYCDTHKDTVAKRCKGMIFLPFK